VEVASYDGNASQLAVRRVGPDYYIYAASRTGAMVLRFRGPPTEDDVAKAR